MMGNEQQNRAILVRGGGDWRPLFLVHDGIGGLHYASALSPHIHSNLPVYGLPFHQTADGLPFRTVQAMAARMIESIRQVQPVGPYRIAGWSFGGMLAYEIATQFMGQDQGVEFLGLLDTHCTTGTNESLDGSPEDGGPENHDRLRLYIDWEARSNPALQAAFRQLKPPEAAPDIRAWVQKDQETSSFPGYFPYLAAKEAPGCFARACSLGLANLQYCPQPIPIPIHLFSPAEPDATDPLLGWLAVLPKSLIQVMPVMGTHQSMLETPNLEMLGASLSKAQVNGAARKRKLPERSYSPLVTLQSGRVEKAPLFCIPGAGASVSSFVELGMSLGEDWPIFGFQPRGLDGLCVPHSTVLAAAESYRQAIQHRYSERPIHLIGHSFGGWAAFEMALRLSETGCPVASLTILDSEVPETEGSRVCEYNRMEVNMKLIEIFEQTLERSLDIQPGDLNSFDEATQRALIHERLVRFGIFSRRSQSDALRGPLRTFAASLRTRYRPDRDYSRPVRLVLVEDPKLDQYSNQLKRERTVRGWTNWAPNLMPVQVGGNHMTVLKAPYVHALAACMFPK